MAIIKRNKEVARRKGTLAAAATGGSVALLALGAPVILGVVGLGAAGYLGYDWLKFRIKNGMRF